MEKKTRPSKTSFRKISQKFYHMLEEQHHFPDKLVKRNRDESVSTSTQHTSDLSQCLLLVRYKPQGKIQAVIGNFGFILLMKKSCTS